MNVEGEVRTRVRKKRINAEGEMKIIFKGEMGFNWLLRVTEVSLK